MGLLAPLFLLGALAVALPVWLHRLKTQSSDRQPFGSAMLLESTEERVHVQKKLRYLVLLALRITLLLLIALAFAKPYLARPLALLAGDAGTGLILVDTSLSMGRAGVFDQALAVANQLVDDAAPGALLQVLHVDEALHIAGGLSANKAELRAAVAALEVSALRADFGQAIAAVDRLAESLPQPVTLHLVSDYQQSAMPVRFADVVPTQIARLLPHVVGTGAPVNWSVEYLRETEAGFDIGVFGYGDRERVADVEVLLNGAVVATEGVSETGRVALHFDGLAYAAGDNRVRIRINADDDLAGDNNWFHVVDNRAPSAVPLLTLDPDGLPVTYLAAALAADTERGYELEPLVIGDFDPRLLERHRFIVIDDLGSIDATLETALTAYLQGGGRVLAFAGDRAAGGRELPLSGHRLAAAGVATGRFLAPGRIDMQHPVLANTEGWHSVNVSRPMPVELQEGDVVLIRLENNDPLLIEKRIGAGTLLLFLNGLDNRWNDLPVRPVFVSFMVESAAWLSGSSGISRTYTTGASLPLSLIGGASGQVIDPDGNTVLSLADTTRAQRINLDKPGIYEVYTTEGSMLVAANIDPRESALATISQELLDRWQDAVAPPAAVGSGQSATVDAEPLEIWHWLLLLLALVIIAESVLGNAYLAPLEKGVK